MTGKTDPAQIGQPEQARRHQRHMGQTRQSDDFGDRAASRNANNSPASWKISRILGGGIFPSRNKRVCGRCKIGRVCGAAGVYRPSRR